MFDNELMNSVSLIDDEQLLLREVSKYGDFSGPYFQKKLRIWTLFRQCITPAIL